MKKTLSLLFALGLGLAAHAGSQLQQDTSTNLLAASSTNTYTLYGDITGNYTNGYAFGVTATGNTYTNGVLVSTESGGPVSFIDCTKTTQTPFDVGGYFANTAANASNVVFAIYSSVDLHLWSLATNIVLSVPGATTNWAHAQFFISGGTGMGLMPDYALRAVLNTNSTVSTPSTAGTNANVGSLYLKAFTKTGI